MYRAHVLVIEDEAPIADVLVQALRRSGYDVAWASDGDDGLALAQAGRPDLVLLDLMLPGMDGWEICRRLRANPDTRNTPIIMVTARRDEGEVVAGLSAGADDYIRKPFSLAELLARVATRLRRHDDETSDDDSEEGRMTLDGETGVARFGDRSVDLSPTEFQILEILARRPDRPVSRQRIMALVWGLDSAESRTLDTHLSRLRKKLAACPGAPSIATLRGRGCRLEWED